jgi:chaperonin cofactor prefoldin
MDGELTERERTMRRHMDALERKNTRLERRVEQQKRQIKALIRGKA